MEAYLDSEKSLPLATKPGHRRQQGGVTTRAATLEGRYRNVE